MVNPTQIYGALTPDLMHILVGAERQGSLTKELKKQIFATNHAIVSFSKEELSLQEEVQKIEELIESLIFSPILFEENSHEFDETVYGERFDKMVAILQKTEVTVTIESYCDGLTPRNGRIARERVQSVQQIFNCNQISPIRLAGEPKGNVVGWAGIGLNMFQRKIVFNVHHNPRDVEETAPGSIQLPDANNPNAGVLVFNCLEQQKKEVSEKTSPLKHRILEILDSHQNIIFGPLLFKRRCSELNVPFYKTQIQLIEIYLNWHPSCRLKIQGGYHLWDESWEIAKKRAKTVREALVVIGTSEEKLLLGSGVIVERTDFAMADRRVVFSVISV